MIKRWFGKHGWLRSWLWFVLFMSSDEFVWDDVCALISYLTQQACRSTWSLRGFLASTFLFKLMWVVTLKALSTLSQKSATVAEEWECRRKRRDNGDSRRNRRQSQFSATNCRTFLWQCGQALTMHRTIGLTGYIGLLSFDYDNGSTIHPNRLDKNRIVWVN